MLDKQKRLNEVYEHLRNYFGIHTKGDFADSIKYARAYISSALNGNEKYLTDKLFRNICDAYPGVFDLNYLLTGEGQLLTIEEEVKNEDIKKTANPTPAPSAIDYTFLIEKAVEKATAYADKTIAVLEKQVADKDREIATLNARIRELETIIKIQTTDNPLGKYPFPVGVADDGSIHIITEK
jgi:hypothetical protein